MATSETSERTCPACQRRLTFVAWESKDLSRAGNGTVRFRLTEPGIYEASGVYRSYRGWRVVFRVTEAGTIDCLGDDASANLRAIYRQLFPVPEPAT